MNKAGKSAGKRGRQNKGMRKNRRGKRRWTEREGNKREGEKGKGTQGKGKKTRGTKGRKKKVPRIPIRNFLHGRPKSETIQGQSAKNGILAVSDLGTRNS